MPKITNDQLSIIQRLRAALETPADLTGDDLQKLIEDAHTFDTLDIELPIRECGWGQYPGRGPFLLSIHYTLDGVEKTKYLHFEDDFLLPDSIWVTDKDQAERYHSLDAAWAELEGHLYFRFSQYNGEWSVPQEILAMGEVSEWRTSNSVKLRIAKTSDELICEHTLQLYHPRDPSYTEWVAARQRLLETRDAHRAEEQRQREAA